MIEYSELKEKLKEINTMADKEAKQIIFEILSITQSCMTLEDLKKFLLPNQFQNIKTRIEQWAMEEIPPVDGWSNEKVNEAYNNIVNSTKFFLVSSGQEDFELERFGVGDSEIFAKVNPDNVSYQDFSIVAKMVMAKQSKYDKARNENEIREESAKALLDEALLKISERITNDIINKLNRLQEMSEKERMQTILQAMSMIQSSMEITDIEKILPAREYKAFRKKLEAKMKEEYPEKEAWAGESIKSLRQSAMEEELFYIQYEGNNKFSLSRFNYMNTERFAEINLDEIIFENLNLIANSIMKQYKENGIFDSNEILNAENIKIVLDEFVKNQIIDNSTNMYMEENDITVDRNQKWYEKIKRKFM